MKQQKYALKEYEHEASETSKALAMILLVGVIIGWIILVIICIKLGSIESQLNQIQENKTQEDCYSVYDIINEIKEQCSDNEEILLTKKFNSINCEVGTAVRCNFCRDDGYCKIEYRCLRDILKSDKTICEVEK